MRREGGFADPAEPVNIVGVEAQAQKGVRFARKDELARFALTSPATIKEASAT